MVVNLKKSLRQQIPIKQIVIKSAPMRTLTHQVATQMHHNTPKCPKGLKDCLNHKRVEHLEEFYANSKFKKNNLSILRKSSNTKSKLELMNSHWIHI